MINLVKKALEQYGMLQNVRAVTVALSGGADSVALLNAMLKLTDEYGIVVKAAHLNHNLRGAESDRDEQFVRALCAKENVELKVKSVDINALAKEKKQSVELAARNARYDFFDECGGIIATAHTADDNIETVLLNMVRGSGAEGLCGIPPVRDNFVRPLIMCTRSQVEEFCKQNKLDYVTDSTNLTDDYTRNKIRHNAVSVLKEVNPSAVSAVLRTCEILRDENAFVARLAQKEYEILAKNGGLDVKNIKSVDKALLRRVLRLLFEDVAKSTLDSFHTEQLVSLAYKGEGRCQLGGGFCAEVVQKVLKITKDGQKNVEFEVETEKISFDQYKEKLKVNSLLSKNAIDCDKIIGDTIVRSRKEGDAIKLMNKGTKTLKKLYNELGIEKCERQNMPVLADDSGVIWVYNAGADVRVQIDANTKKVLLISVNKVQ